MPKVIRWYKFNEDTSYLGNDSSEYQKDLTNFGVKSVTDNVYGKVAYFDGSSYLRLSLENIPSNMEYGYSRTMSFWMKPTVSSGQGLITYGNKVSNGSFGRRYAVVYDNSNSKISILHFNVLPTSTGSNVISKDEWNHITVVFHDTGNLSRIYINGELSISAVKNLNTSPNHNLYIGWYQEDGNHFVGYMSDMRFYDGALEATEVSDLYNETIHTVESNLYIVSKGSSYVELEWDPLSPGTVYTITTLSGNTFVSTVETQETRLTITGLLPSTNYELELHV